MRRVSVRALKGGVRLCEGFARYESEDSWMYSRKSQIMQGYVRQQRTEDGYEGVGV